MYVNQGDTLTIQLQGQSPTSTVGAAVGLLISFGSSIADKIANNIVSYMGGQGFGAAVDADNINPDGTIFVQIDVTAGQDYGSEQDVLSIAQTAWYNAGTNQEPSSAVVTDINGTSIASGISSSGSSTLLGAVSNPSTIASPIASGVSSLASAGSDFLWLKNFGTTTLVLIVVIIVALLYFLSTESGSGVARAALA